MDPFVAEIRIFSGNFAPKGWATCDGQLLPLSQNTALFSLLGTYYGGDGKTTFALPDIAGSAVLNQGQGPALSDRFLGETGGTDTVTLLTSEAPIHPHTMNASGFGADLKVPGPDRVLAKALGANAYQDNSTQNLQMLDPMAVSIVGGDLPHNNMQPFLALTFIIALQGIFPPRS
ncbi:MAG: hypothetical protein QOH61_264 [Chloroflexota bacterium]|jgi:microcystin-dependent protein|nr:hypothetical protein [Chloroflexota bacterium]